MKARKGRQGCEGKGREGVTAGWVKEGDKRWLGKSPTPLSQPLNPLIRILNPRPSISLRLQRVLGSLIRSEANLTSRMMHQRYEEEAFPRPACRRCVSETDLCTIIVPYCLTVLMLLSCRPRRTYGRRFDEEDGQLEWKGREW